MVFTPLSYLDPETKPADKAAARQDVPLSAHVFNNAPHQHAMHMAVVYYLDALRSGTASAKTRSELSFSGRKLRPQKGTGHARLSDAGNPMLRKGGVAHGPRPRDFKTELPRKVRELALRSALSARWREGALFVVPSLAWKPPPTTTGPLARLLGAKQWRDTLFLSAPRKLRIPKAARRSESRSSALNPRYGAEQLKRHANYVRNFQRAARNLQDIELLELHQLSPHDKTRADDAKKPGELHAYQVLQYPKLVLDLGALEWLEEKLGGAFVHEVHEQSAEELQSEVDASEELAGAEGDALASEPIGNAQSLDTSSAAAGVASR